MQRLHRSIGGPPPDLSHQEPIIAAGTVALAAVPHAAPQPAAGPNVAQIEKVKTIDKEPGR